MSIKLEVGRRYVDGGSSGKPEKIDRQIDGYFVSEYGFKYTEDGRFIGGFGAHSADSRANLVALAPDEVPQQADDDVDVLIDRLATQLGIAGAESREARWTDQRWQRRVLRDAIARLSQPATLAKLRGEQ